MQSGPSASDYELSMVSYLYTRPHQFAVHGYRLSEMRAFDYGPARDLFDILYKVHKKYNRMPTSEELDKLIIKYGVSRKWAMAYREQVREDASRLGEIETTEITGEFLSHFIIQKKTASLAQKLGVENPEDTLKNIADHTKTLQELQVLGARDFHRGVFPFSPEVLENPNAFIEDAYGGDPVPLGIERLDSRLNGGLRPGEMAIVVAATGVGKAHPMDTRLMTPTGWIKMGDVKVGDTLIGSSGRATTVTAIHPRGVLKTYTVNFSDGTSVRCSPDHLWTVQAQGANEYGVLSLREICLRGLVCPDGSRRWQVPLVSNPVEFASGNDPEDPYLVGRRVITHNEPIDDKHLVSSVKSRHEMLKGLLDSCSVDIMFGGLFVCSSNQYALALVRYLTLSLGGCTTSISRTPGADKSLHDLTIRIPKRFKVLSDPDTHKEYEKARKDPFGKWIVSVTQGPREECQCITVDADDSLYCAEIFTLTHNSLLMVDIANHVVSLGKRVIYYALDNTQGEMLERIFANATGIPISAKRTDDWGKEISDRVGGPNHLFYLIDFPPKAIDTADLKRNLQMTRAELRAIDLRSGVPEEMAGHIDMVLVDYGDQLKPATGYNEYRLQLKDVFEDLTSIAKSEKVPLISASQANRKALSKEVVTLEDLAEAFNKSWPASLVMTVCQTLAERNQDRLRLAVVKARREANYYVVPCTVDYKSMRVRDNPQRDVTPIEGIQGGKMVGGDSDGDYAPSPKKNVFSLPKPNAKMPKPESDAVGA